MGISMKIKGGLLSEQKLVKTEICDALLKWQIAYF